jgi:hypothetical protein
VGYDVADTRWKLMHRTGTGTVIEVDLGASFPKPSADRTKMYELVIFAEAGASTMHYEFKDLGTGAVVSDTRSSDLPANTSLLKTIMAASVGGVSDVIGIAVSSVYVETDY